MPILSLRLLGRYFRSCDYPISTISRDHQSSPSRLAILRKDFHLHEVANLPIKLGAWAGFIDIGVLPGTSAPQVQAVVTSLQGLSSQIRGLLEEGNTHQAQFLVQKLELDLRTWRLNVKKTFQSLAKKPDDDMEETFRTRLAEIMVHMETRIKETLEKATGPTLFNQRKCCHQSCPGL